MAFQPTPEQEQKMNLIRVLVGDTEGSMFYPILTDAQYYDLLQFEKWDVYRAARRAGISISLHLAQETYRERTGDIEVWNNASIEYRKALSDFLDNKGVTNLPSLIRPYASGISKADMCKYLNDPDTARSPLSQISPCVAWWTRVEGYDCCNVVGGDSGGDIPTPPSVQYVAQINNKTPDIFGYVELFAGDIDGFSPVAISGSYNDLVDTPEIPVLVPATKDSLGVVQAGSGIDVDENGVISVSSSSAGYITSVNDIEPDSGGAVNIEAEDIPGISNVGKTGQWDDVEGKPEFGTAALTDSDEYATAEQGDKADTAVQPTDLADVAISGDYTDLGNTPVLGTASSRDVPDSGDASATQVVLGSDSRLTDSRQPLPHSHEISDVNGLQNALDSKVNVEEGKGLSSEDFTEIEKNKLANISDGATANRSDSDTDLLLDEKVDKVSGKQLSTEDYTTTEKNKLGGIAIGATANRSDAETDDLLDDKADKTSLEEYIRKDGVAPSSPTTTLPVGLSPTGELLSRRFATIPEAQEGNSNAFGMTPQGTKEFLKQFGLTQDSSPLVSDLNTVINGQNFQTNASTINAPTESFWGRGLTLPASTTNSTQIIISNGNSRVYVRYQASGTWSPWTKIYDPVEAGLLEYRISGGNLQWKYIADSVWRTIAPVLSLGLPAATSDQMNDPADVWNAAVTPQRLFYYLRNIGLMSPFRTALTDLNDAILGISFQFNPDTLNTPTVGYGKGTTWPASDIHTTQIALINGQTTFWIRDQNNGVWTAWRQMTASDTSALKIANNLSDLADVSAARDNLGLGTAAVADVQTSTSDATAGRVLLNGAFGIGIGSPRTVGDYNTYKDPGKYCLLNGSTNGPVGALCLLDVTTGTWGSDTYRYLVQQATVADGPNSGRVYIRTSGNSGNSWSAWREILSANSRMISGTSWDLITEPGFYFGNAANVTDGPWSNWTYMHVINRGSLYVTQLAYGLNSASLQASRVLSNGVWGPWVRGLTTGDEFGFGGAVARSNLVSTPPEEPITRVFSRITADDVPSSAASIQFVSGNAWGRLRTRHNGPGAWVQGGNGFGSSPTYWTRELLFREDLTVETGNWTPTLTDTGGEYTVSGSSSRYVRQGNQVTLYATFSVQVVTVGSNALNIGNLPYAKANGWAIPVGECYHEHLDLPVGHENICAIFPSVNNTRTIQLRSKIVGGPGVNLTGSSLGTTTNSAFRIVISYTI